MHKSPKWIIKTTYKKVQYRIEFRPNDHVHKNLNDTNSTFAVQNNLFIF